MRDHISWDEYFMGIALLSCERSKDPSTQVGCCIVNSKNKILGIGYNGFPTGCDDKLFPWSREAEKELDTKYPYICHAEMNAILNSNTSDLTNCSLYTTLFPCNECAKLIIQCGIKKVIYLSDKYAKTFKVIAAKKMFDAVEVLYTQYKGRILIPKFE